jgi:hypothetical protein
MNNPRHDLESELRSLRPQAPSDRVHRGIAEQLAATARVRAVNNFWAWGGAALAVAAGLTALVIFWPGPTKKAAAPGAQIVVVPEEVKPPPRVDPLPEAPPPPTWMAYRHELSESVESFDALLDKHAASLLGGGPSGPGSGPLFQKIYQN